MTLEEFNNLEKEKAQNELLRCCGSRNWAEQLMENSPFDSIDDLLEKSDEVWEDCNYEDWMEAFSQHPKIGSQYNAEAELAETQTWAEDEQSRVKEAPENVLAELADLNNKYFNKHGYIFIVSATGKSAEEMLALLKARINNEETEEMDIAANEQNKITHIRIRKLLS